MASVVSHSQPAGAPADEPPGSTTRAPLTSTWEAHLGLTLAAHGPRTVLAGRRHHGPMSVQRPFYPEGDGTCHLYLLHPPGGIAGGDTLRIAVENGVGARSLLTTPAATKLYRSDGRVSGQHQRIQVARGGRCEWLPQETIAFEGTNADLTNEVHLEGDALFMGWDILCLGRPACGEGFTHGRVGQRWQIFRDGRPVWIERAQYRGGAPLLSADWGMQGHPVVGAFLCVAPEQPGLATALRERLSAHTETGHVAVSQLSEVLVVRYLGPSVEQARRAFETSWLHLRETVCGAVVRPPRIWAT